MHVALGLVALFWLICMGTALFFAIRKPRHDASGDISNFLKSIDHDPKVVRANSQVLCKGRQ